MNKLFVLALSLLCTGVFAQGVGINGTGAPAHSSAGLDIDFNNKGLLPPRLTTVQRDAISGPANGLVIYNTDSDCLNIWNGATWRQSCFDCDFTPPSVGNNGPICAGSTLNLTAATIGGATYSWTGPNGFSSSSQNPSIPNATTAASGTYELAVSLNGCTANAVTTFATVNAAPSAPVLSSNAPLCPGATLNLSAATIPGATYSWNGPNGFSSTLQAPTVSNVSETNEGYYVATATANGCVGPADSIQVIVNDPAPATPGSISGSTAFVSGQTGVVYSISSVTYATTYTWTVPSGATIVSGQGTTSITVNFGSSPGNICVTAGNSCGTSSASCATVSPCSSSYVNETNWTQNNPTYESSQLPGSSYDATNTLDGSTGSFWLSDNGLITNQWIIYDIGSVKQVSGIRISNGQNPFSAKNMKLQSGPSLSGPWTDVHSFTATDADAVWQTFTGFSVSSQYWRLYFFDNYGSVNYIKLREMELNVCQ